MSQPEPTAIVRPGATVRLTAIDDKDKVRDTVCQITLVTPLGLDILIERNKGKPPIALFYPWHRIMCVVPIDPPPAAEEGKESL